MESERNLNIFTSSSMDSIPIRLVDFLIWNNIREIGDDELMRI